MRKRVKKLLHNDEKCVTIKALYVNLLLGGIRIMATFYASKTGEVSAREKEHSALVRELAGECMTLLENDGTLPLAGAGKVAVYGNGVRHTVKGGTGSGDVNTRTVVTIEQGLKEAGFEILTGKWLDEYDKVHADAQAAYQAELAKKAEELHIPIFAVMFSEAFAQPDVPAITEKRTPIPLSTFCQETPVKVQTAITEHAIICSAKTSSLTLPIWQSIMRKQF